MPLWQDFKKSTLNHHRQKETYHYFSEKTTLLLHKHKACCLSLASCRSCWIAWKCCSLTRFLMVFSQFRVKPSAYKLYTCCTIMQPTFHVWCQSSVAQHKVTGTWKHDGCIKRRLALSKATRLHPLQMMPLEGKKPAIKPSSHYITTPPWSLSKDSVYCVPLGRFPPKISELLVPGTAFGGTKSFLQRVVVCVSTVV